MPASVAPAFNLLPARVPFDLTVSVINQCV